MEESVLCGCPHWQMGFTHRRTDLPTLGILWVLTLGLLSQIVTGDTGIVSEFPSTDFAETSLNRMVVDGNNAVFIGAVNNLYKLNTDLQLTQSSQTGPVQDSRECVSWDNVDKGQCIDYNAQPVNVFPTNLVNKVLLIDPNQRVLITCWNVHQGACEVRQLNNISHAVSKDDRGSYVSVVPNNELSPAVAFFGPGPSSSNGNDALYVGATYPEDFKQQGNGGSFYVVSTRLVSGNKFFDLANKDIFSSLGTYKHLTQTWEEYSWKSPKYIGGFSADVFNYFVTVQTKYVPKPDGNSMEKTEEYISKIVRLCGSDKFYISYIEMELECKVGSTKYNLVQDVTLALPGKNLAGRLGIQTSDLVIFATFAKGEEPPHNNKPTTESALCIYSLASITERFTENIKACYRGEGYQVPLYAADVRILKCFEDPSVSIDNNFCGNSRDKTLNNPIEGSLPMTAAPVLTKSDSLLTAVAIDTVSDHTVAFVGTSKGSLLKVLVDSTVSSSLYAEVVLDQDNPILGDLLFSNQHDFIYGMSERKVYKVLIETCREFQTCQDCLGARDPYCGWCTLENKCTRYSECQQASSRLRWLSPYKSSPANQCVNITKVEPHSAPLTGDTTKVTLTVDQLPPNTGGGYQCLFGSDAATVMAIEQDDKLICNTPLNKLPTIPDGETTLNVTLSIKSLDTNSEFLSTPFSFFDCAKYTACSSCAGSIWGCRWCVHDNACVDNRATCATVITGPIMDDLYCPRLETTGPIIIPAGQTRQIHIDAHNLPQPIGNQGGYECNVLLPKPMRIPARREDSQRIICLNAKYTYSSSDGQVEARIQVLWNRHFAVDDKYGLTGIVYKCENMGTDCSLCNNLFNSHPKYGCKYCGGQCQYNATCSAPHTNTCPAPTVENVVPNTSPLQGGTKITIFGSNLGSSYSQVKAVTIGNVPCELIEDEYLPAKRIVCITRPKTLSSGEVRVQIGTATGSWAGQLFHYQEPMLDDITPKKGPLAGGTRLTIVGSKLNTGLNIKAFLDEGPCVVLREEVTDDAIICLTPEMRAARTTSKVAITFDGYRIEMPAAFTYLPNPNITSISPLSSYASGGRKITIRGDHFNVVKSPKMLARFNGRVSVPSQCDIMSNNEMLCRSPNVCTMVPLSDLCKEPVVTANRRRRQTSSMVEVGFEMDNVESVRNLSGYFPDLDSTLIVYPDPVYYNFTSGVREYKGESLKLMGKHLDFACTAEEVTVTVGGEPCEVYSLAEEELHCRPPEKQPTAQNSEDPGVLPFVEIRVGRLSWTPGRLKYQEPIFLFPQGAIIGIVVGGGILVLIIIIILIIYRRKSSEAERQYKKMQIQLDTLESNVRNECKQAFAELQTEVSDLTSDLNVTGIPFWDYKTYTFKVLFPSHTDHPVLHKKLDVADTKLGGYEQGLAQFNQLLNSKQFLLIFIRTLESQKNFSIRDKAQVASLLMIVLQDKMEYATEILKSLLNELIDKSVEKKHPKLMLRRMESVVEKLLTNWMSVCMYSYIKRHAGRSLYMLYKAIKQQTEKGPVDAITSEARYSLSEDRLLREKIDHKVLGINLVVEGQPSDPVMCRVLDCDTITQAKEKALDAVYMNTPFSRRPSVFDVDLEWRSGRSGHLPLQDEDVTTELIRSWKRVNTLAHYHVPDGATMALVPKRNKNDYVRQVHGMVEITGGGSLSNLNPIITVEDGTKVWHLVKHDDSQNQSRTQKVISEIFLTRLLATKGTVQQFIDDLFLTVLKVDNVLPPAIKYLFDFLDQAARRHNIVDAEVVHTWKSNSLPLRFWVNIIKNPEFVFDIHKSHITDSCLSVIAQTFMDSCSTSEHRLGKDSPSNKLLFAKDITKYRKWVEKYYRDIQEMPPVSDFEMNRTMTELSMSNMVDFNVSCALKELYRYATQYNFELLESLDDDPSAKKLHLANKFEQVAAMIDGSPMY